jgi:ribosome-associated toxin RatA of RatAB toxin-antitoxin module
MRHISIVARAPGRSAADIYRVISAFDRYPEHASVVRSVSVEPLREGVIASSWEVEFRDGILKWTEEDTFLPDQHRISFRQLAGDVETFTGEWAVADAEGAANVRFEADMDLGIPGIGDMLEPIAEQALGENIRAILTGLVGNTIEFIQPG